MNIQNCIEAYGYQEYDGPMLEPFELYAAKTGEEIVEKQLYWFLDRGERKVAMRPEMTPTMARMVAAQVMELPKPIRWYSIPNLWRYERPQRGRLREHWQLNVDVLGGDELLADAEILEVAHAVIEAFGGGDKIEILINHRRLVDHFFSSVLGLSTDVALAVVKKVDARDKIGEEAYLNGLRELGLSGDQLEQMEKFFSSSLDVIAEWIPCPGAEHLQKLMKQCAAIPGLKFDPTIMRGLDYYTGTVFEIFDTSPDNNRAMFGGGRYDNLIGMFGRQELSGIGFGMGDVTLANFLETHELIPPLHSMTDVFITLPIEAALEPAQHMRTLLQEMGLRVITPLSIGKFGNQLKQAAKHEARVALLLGPDELASGQVGIKDLETGEQKTISQVDLEAEMDAIFFTDEDFQ